MLYLTLLDRGIFSNLNARIIAATAGGDLRSDRCISLWDAKTGNLLKRLDNGTSKCIVALLFHPMHESLLLSADMEFDVKLWDWKTGELLKVWKKHHTRIIYRIALVPGSEDL
jgi:WD40 repeat protein